jgi:hypothetical protein
VSLIFHLVSDQTLGLNQGKLEIWFWLLLDEVRWKLLILEVNELSWVKLLFESLKENAQLGRCYCYWSCVVQLIKFVALLIGNIYPELNFLHQLQTEIAQWVRCCFLSIIRINLRFRMPQRCNINYVAPLHRYILSLWKFHNSDHRLLKGKKKLCHSKLVQFCVIFWHKEVLQMQFQKACIIHWIILASSRSQEVFQFLRIVYWLPPVSRQNHSRKPCHVRLSCE